jgi:hypothetical protein
MPSSVRITDGTDTALAVGVSRPLFAAISASTSGDTLIVAGVAGYRVRVVKYSLVCADGVVVTWESSTAGAITGPMTFAVNGGICESYCPAGVFQTAVGEGLVLNLSGNISVGGSLTYTLIPSTD